MEVASVNEHRDQLSALLVYSGESLFASSGPDLGIGRAEVDETHPRPRRLSRQVKCSGLKGWSRCFLCLYPQQRLAMWKHFLAHFHCRRASLYLFFNVIRSSNWAHLGLGGTAPEKQAIAKRSGPFVESGALLDCTGWPTSDLRNYSAVCYFAS